MERVNTHIVIKREDALKYLTEVEYQTLEAIQSAISRGRKEDGKDPINNYYVCNLDEDYAEIIRDVIRLGEERKNLAVRLGTALAEKGAVNAKEK